MGRVVSCGFAVVLGASFEWGLQNRGPRGAAPSSPQSQLSFLKPPARQSLTKWLSWKAEAAKQLQSPGGIWGFGARIKLSSAGERGEGGRGSSGVGGPTPVPQLSCSPVVV